MQASSSLKCHTLSHTGSYVSCSCQISSKAFLLKLSQVRPMVTPIPAFQPSRQRCSQPLLSNSQALLTGIVVFFFNGMSFEWGEYTTSSYSSSPSCLYLVLLMLILISLAHRLRPHLHFVSLRLTPQHPARHFGSKIKSLVLVNWLPSSRPLANISGVTLEYSTSVIVRV